MFRIITSSLALALCASLAQVGAAAQEYPPPEALGPPSAATATPDPLLLMRAKSWFAQLQSGNIDRSELATDSPNANLTDATIANARKMIGNLGRPVSFVQQQAATQGGVTAAIYLVTFKNGQKVDFLFAVDSQGKIAGLGLGKPH
jgi:hypothetical protein